MVKGFQSNNYVMVKEASKCEQAFSSKLSGKGYSSKNVTVQYIQALYINV